MIDGSKVVLLVEDSLIVREMTRRVLVEAGYVVRTAVGHNDLEKQILRVPGFVDGVDLLVLDMELLETQERMQGEQGVDHLGMQMTGSQIGATFALAYPQLENVPFLIYSGKDLNEIQAHLDELAEFKELNQQIRENYKGFVPKQAGAETALLGKIDEILGARSARRG